MKTLKKTLRKTYSFISVIIKTHKNILSRQISQTRTVHWITGKTEILRLVKLTFCKCNLNATKT